MPNKVVGVQIEEDSLTYCFFNQEIKENDKIVVSLEETPYLGIVVNVRDAREGEKLSIYPVIDHLASKEDVDTFNANCINDINFLRQTQKEADKLALKMNIFRVSSSLDASKVKIMYTAEERVDFRELLKILAPMFHARIELRQVGPRDKAKMIGGLGICGLKLCCSTFLNSFDGISISMAKNQMLAINIPKLSGQCGKLICCLKYEDAAYALARKEFPSLNASFTYNGIQTKVTGINVLSQTVTLASDNDTFVMTKADFDKHTVKSNVPATK